MKVQINEDGTCDYRKLDYANQSHHLRYVGHINRDGFICQECGGSGELFEEYLLG